MRMDYFVEVQASKQRALEARTAYEYATAQYRLVVRAAVLHWKTSEGLSVRAAAARLNLSESSLRELLRHPDVSRKMHRQKK